MIVNTTLNYSPNFDVKKRKNKEIKFIVYHYTGMKKEKDALKKLTDPKSKVSCNYYIKYSGEILTLIPDLYTSWHAGISYWEKFSLINNSSIGVEISNPGHEHNYKKFSKKQIFSIIKLSKFLIRKYKIKSNFILGHSDIAPDRKKDPGEKFPWKYLAKQKIGFWHNLKTQYLIKLRNKTTNQIDKKIFIRNLFKIGYSKNFYKNKNSVNLTKAFQRRFRQELINGFIDKECLIISKNLTKRMK